MTSIHEQYKKKGGRPPTGRVRKLSKSVTVKFSKPSYEALKLRARKANRKLAEYIRESALNGEVVSGHNAETVAIAKNLIGMANNLNQLAKLSHHNTDNPHCHIVYNRINNEGKLLSGRNDYRRNEQVTKALKSRYGLTYGTDKSNTNTRKLRNAERAKYEIHNAVNDALEVADSWQKFKNELAKRGVHLELVYKDKERTKVQGIRFCKDGYSFKGTQISRGYSFGKLNARFEGMENHVSPKSSSTLQYEQGYHKSKHEPSMSDSSQDPWDGISSIGLFASANAQTFEPFPEDESSKKKKKKRRRGFSL